MFTRSAVCLLRRPRIYNNHLCKSLGSHRFISTNNANPVENSSTPLDSDFLQETVNTVLDHSIWWWVPHEQLNSGLLFLNETCGLPLWSGIVISSLAFRVAFLPLTRLQILESAKLQKVSSLLQMTVSDLRKDLNTSKTPASIFTALSSFSVKRKAVKRTVAYSALRRWSSLLQIPALVTFSIALRKIMVDHGQEADNIMSTGGAFWFPDLTLKDPFAALPLFSLALAYVVLNDISKRYPSGSLVHSLLDAFQVVKLLMFPFMSQVPAGICLLWVSSGAYSLAYLRGLHNSTFRRVLRLPKLDVLNTNTIAKPRNPNI